ncbi:glycoside hydrolase family 3 N-terminal domain-containing protein [Verminephrobacter aporrectodeae]|uniref:glycoside hydrolase family 3 N-terminal domain-containing protein n=1 Tax=Verminephrobacter aporrectodeae TaxID=1110389 RepID=UPI00224332DE|nr:glycoside hydrolase family 3 N-terminal domain-containing protein [Verminephrobacter aporrectodeae]MCW8176752.1 beta-glucosidase [Verminephrobacter aporrectodeae subsp. tuberculatae]MCW8204499.1 beta-glucosidase [Verminephrobacter aporrectodeae subsp. tuberculatae]
MNDTTPTPVSAPLYKDPAQPLDARVHDLLARMSLDEKIAQLHAFWLILSEDGKHRVRPGTLFIEGTGQQSFEHRLAHGVGQITRPLGTHSVEAGSGLRALNRLQRFLRNETRLGIPALAHEECLVGLMTRDATAFPSALALSASWNPELVESVAQQIRHESQQLGCHQGLAPVLDVSRDVRWGRTEETFGEDPYLVGVLATRYVRGLQGPRRDLLATLKHFVGHSFSEGARNHAPVHVGWRELSDVFLLPFEMAVKQANAGSVMPAYHDIDGEPCHASRQLLTDVLRTRWGFDGLVVADYSGVSLLYQHHRVAADAADAAALSFNAGLDVELPADDCARNLRLALDRGAITPARIDEIVARVLKEKFRLGLFERSFEDPAEPPLLRSPASVAAAREAARQSIVVLENRSGILPLDPSVARRIAVIGPTADDPMGQLSGYSYHAHFIDPDEALDTGHIVTPLQGIARVFAAGQLHHEQGCWILEHRRAGSPVFPGDLRDDANAPRQASPVSLRTDRIPAAAQAARTADLAIVCVGDLAGLFQRGTVGEGSDTDSLSLPGVQQQLLEAVVATGTPTIAVLSGGRPYNLGGLEDRLAAFVMAFAGGQEGGIALAEVLAGQVEPSGRMTLSTPINVGAMPCYYNHKLKSGGTPIALHFGSRYPFGHGLSYTRFDYRSLQVGAPKAPTEDGEFEISFEIANTGSRPGVEVAQLYVRDCQASVVRPVRELKAFRRVQLDPGQRARVRFHLPVDMLGFTGMAGQRIVEPGLFDVAIGASSADIRLQTQVEAVGESRILGRTWRMESRSQVQPIK